MTPIFIYKPENPDLLKAINKARLIPVKRMVRGKYGSYMAIRWVAPEDIEHNDKRISNPSRDELHAANADRSVESVMRRMNNMPKEYDSPDGLRTYVAKLLQDCGGGHDAMNAVLEAMSENGVDIESSDNVPATWARNLGKIQDYLSQHAHGGDSASKVEARKKKEQPAPSPKEEPKPEPAPKKEKPVKESARKTKKQTDEEVDTDDTSKQWAKAPQKVKGVHVYRKPEEYEHYAWGDEDEPDYDYINAPHILYPNEESDRFEVEWQLKAKSKKEALTKFYKKFSAALQALIDAGDDENGVASDMLNDISTIPDSIKNGELDIEYKDTYSWFDCEYIDGDEYYIDCCRRYPKNREEPAPNPAPKDEEPEPEPVSVKPEDVAPISEEELKENAADDGLDPLIDRNSTVNGLRLTNKAVAAVKKDLPENCVIRSVGIFSATLDNESNQVNLIISAQVHNNETGYDYELPVYYPGMLGDAIDFIEQPTVTPKQAKEAIDDFLSTPSGQEMFNDEVSVGKKFSNTFDRLSPTVRDHYKYCFDEGAANHLPGLLEIKNYFDNPRTLEGTLLPTIWEQVQTSEDKSKSNRFFDENFANVLRVTDFIDHCEMSEDTVMMQWSNAQCLPKLLGITDIPTNSTDWNKLIGYEFTNNSFTTAYGHDVDSAMMMKNDGDYDVVFMLPKGTKAAYIAPFADTPKTTTYEEDDDSVWDGGSVWNDKTTDYRSPTIIQRGTTFRLMGYKERKVKIGKGRKSIKRKVVYVQAVNQEPYKNDKFGKPPDDFYSSPYRWWRTDNK